MSATCGVVICLRGSTKKPLVLTQLKFESGSLYLIKLFTFCCPEGKTN